MLNVEVCLPQKFYEDHLVVLNDVKFTRREIDITAFLLNGRSTKKIANFLAISPKTVETHLRNIMNKIGCNSREGIIDFAEKSNQLLCLKQHHMNLLIHIAFEKQIIAVANLTSQVHITCRMIYYCEEEAPAAFWAQILEYLKLAGIKISFEIKKPHEPIKNFISDVSLKIAHYNATIVIVAPNQRQIIEERSFDKLPSVIFLLTDDANSINYATNKAIISFNPKDYYLSIFTILKTLYPGNNLESISDEFVKYWQELNYFTEPTSTITPGPVIQLANKYNSKLLVGAFGIISILIVLVFFFKGKIKVLSHQPANEIMIHSEFIVPNDKILLERPKILSQIQAASKGGKNIKTIALVGIGGAGKTTIARHFARRQKRKVIWEINAQTHDSIINSFEHLAFALAPTEQEKNILKDIHETKNFSQRATKLMVLIKAKLKAKGDWLLIYDNVEKFTDIQSYFPQDINVWGKGQVLITTRNTNIHLEHTINIEQLDEHEKLDLFTKIMKNCASPHSFLNNIGEIKKFVQVLPPFPLDIAIAAYYLRATNVSYKQYLNYLNEYDKDFELVQENILKETNNYGKTRYGIITVSLRDLLASHKDFASLLLFISLLDSQNIPRDLLSTYKNEPVVDSLIYNLKRYSLIATETQSSQCDASTISIHRSIQKICLMYLTKKLDLKNDNYLSESIFDTFDTYISEAIEREDVSKFKILVNHCKAFLNQDSVFGGSLRQLIKGRLGSIYCYLGNKQSQALLEDSLQSNNQTSTIMAENLEHRGYIYREESNYEKAKELLERSLVIYRQNPSDNRSKIARVLAHLGNVYRSLGNYEKAILLLEESLNIYKRYFPANHSGLARSLTILGKVYFCKENYAKAIMLFEQSLVIYKEKPSENLLGITRTLGLLGKTYRMLGDYAKAKDFFEQYLQIYKINCIENHLNTEWVYVYLGSMYRLLGDLEKAKATLEQSLKHYKQNYPHNSLKVGWVCVHLGCLYRDLGDYPKAQELIEKGKIIYENVLGVNHIETASVVRNLGEVHLLANNLIICEELTNRALNIYNQNNSFESYMCLEILSDINLKKYLQAIKSNKNSQAQKLKDVAIENLNQALKIVAARLPKNSPHIARLQNKIKQL